ILPILCRRHRQPGRNGRIQVGNGEIEAAAIVAMLHQPGACFRTRKAGQALWPGLRTKVLNTSRGVAKSRGFLQVGGAVLVELATASTPRFPGFSATPGPG